jgi:hypothetical protein
MVVLQLRATVRMSAGNVHMQSIIVYMGLKIVTIYLSFTFSSISRQLLKHLLEYVMMQQPLKLNSLVINFR